MSTLFHDQVDRLKESHFLILYWCAQAEDVGTVYNQTNAFDDLKAAGITRTKQNAIAVVEALSALCFLEVRAEGNRKNLYITEHGARALEALVRSRGFTPRTSIFLEAQS
jgi:hypothetical protein